MQSFLESFGAVVAQQNKQTTQPLWPLIVKCGQHLEWGHHLCQQIPTRTPPAHDSDLWNAENTITEKAGKCAQISELYGRIYMRYPLGQSDVEQIRPNH